MFDHPIVRPPKAITATVTAVTGADTGNPLVECAADGLLLDALLTAERYATADAYNADALVGREVELQLVDGALRIIRVIPQAGVREPIALVNAAAKAEFDTDNLSVTSGGNGASIGVDRAEFAYTVGSNTYGLVVSGSGIVLNADTAALNTLQNAPPQQGRQGAFTFTQQGVSPDNGNPIYQFLVVDTTQNVDEVAVRDSDGNVIGHFLRSEVAARTEAVLCHSSAVAGGAESATHIATPTALTYTVVARSGTVAGHATYAWAGAAGATSYEGRYFSVDDATPNLLVNGVYQAEPGTSGRTRQLFTGVTASPYTTNTFLDDDIRSHAHKPPPNLVPIINGGGTITTGRTNLFRTQSLILNSATAGTPVTATTASRGNSVTVNFTLPGNWQIYRGDTLVTRPTGQTGWQAILDKVRISFYQVRAYSTHLHIASEWSVPYVAVRIFLNSDYEWRAN